MPYEEVIFRILRGALAGAWLRIAAVQWPAMTQLCLIRLIIFILAPPPRGVPGKAPDGRFPYKIGGLGPDPGVLIYLLSVKQPFYILVFGLVTKWR